MGRAFRFPKVTALLFCVTISVASPSHALFEKIVASQKIDPAITYVHKKIRIHRGPIHLHLLRVKLHDPYIVAKPVLAYNQIGRLERTSGIARRVGGTAAINGSFFEPRRRKVPLPIGVLVIDGEIITKSLLSRTALGITEDKQTMFGIPVLRTEIISLGTGRRLTVWGINRPRKKDEVIIYTNEYGATTQTNRHGVELVVEGTTVMGLSDGNTPIPEKGFVVSCHGSSRSFAHQLPVGSEVIVKFTLGESWEKAVQIITGGPRLIENGNVVVTQSVAQENFRGGLLRPTARTAVGVTGDGELLLCVVDRRRGWSVGASYTELAHLLKREGAENAMGLDGGDSSTMALLGQHVNSPMVPGERLVSNALVIKVLREFEQYRGEKATLRENLSEKRTIERRLKRFEHRKKTKAGTPEATDR